MAAEPARVLQLIETGGFGGAETVLLQLAAGLPQDRYRVTAAVGRRAWLAERLATAGVRVHVLPRRRGFDPRSVAAIVRLVRRERIQLVHAHLFRSCLKGSLAARFVGVPFIGTLHGVDDVAGARRCAGNWVAARLGDRLVTVSRHLRDQLARSSRLNSGRVATIHNGVALDAPHDPALRDRVREEIGAGDGPLVGAVGGLRAVKGHAYLLEAIAAVPRARLALVGEGPLRAQLEARATSLGLGDRVRFLGFRSDVRRVLAALDCFVLPSLSEGFSIATIEAMAAGLPVVVTDSGGPAEVVADGETGLVVPPGDAQALARAIARVLDDPALARRLGEAAQRAAQAYGLGHMIAAYDRLYQEVLRAHRIP